MSRLHHPPRPLTRAALLLGVLAAAACDDPGQSPETSREDDQVVFSTTHSTLETVPLLAWVADGIFKADPSWKSLDLDQIQRLAVAITRARLELVLQQLACQTEFDTDGSTYLDASFSNCKLAGFDLEGDFHAEVAAETDSCEVDPSQECKYVTWTLGGPDLSIGSGDKPGHSHFVGPITVRASIDQTQPMTWETQQGFSLQAAGGQKFATRSTASFLVDHDTQCMDISLDARLEIPKIAGGDGSVDGIEIGELVISAQHVMLCPSSCPTSGMIEMAYGNGNILSWEYTGTDKVKVTGPGGREFEGSLRCAGPVDTTGGG